MVYPYRLHFKLQDITIKQLEKVLAVLSYVHYCPSDLPPETCSYSNSLKNLRLGFDLTLEVINTKGSPLTLLFMLFTRKTA